MVARQSAQGFVLVAIVALAACSSASLSPTPVQEPPLATVPSVAPASIPLATRTPTPAPTPVSATPVPATATPSLAPIPAICADPCSVALIERAYSPRLLLVKVGTEVIWTNRSCDGCTVTFTGYGVDSGSMAIGATFKHTFGAAGSYEFHCKLDPGYMVGTITVIK
jgi:plastocyanin